MAIQNLGKVAVTPRGAWDATASYVVLDVVSANGSSYMAKTTVPVGTAVTNTSYWQLLAVKGDTGNGIASIEKTGTSGNIDTYTITYTNGGTATFTVANSLIPDGVVAEYYDTTKSYSPGDYVLYNGGLYRCIESATGAWDSDKWESTSIGADLTLIYAKKNGYYQLMTVGYADNLTPYSSDSGTSQNTPFILQGSGCANGEEQADTGSYCQLKEKRGNTVVVNQLIRNNNFETATVWSKNRCSLSVSANVGIAECTDATASSISIYQHPAGVVGHKYLLGATVKCETTNPATLLYLNSLTSQYDSPVGNNRIENPIQNTWYSLSFIGTLKEGAVYCTPSLYSNEFTLGDKLYIKDTYAIDLTLWFGSNDAIPTHLLNHPEDFFRYYQGDLSYNEGTLTDCNGRYLKTTGRNVWDEQWEIGSINGETGQDGSSTTRIRSKGYTKVAPNTAYYFKHSNVALRVFWYDANQNFISATSGFSNNSVRTTPSNCCYLRFWQEVTAYTNDITISLYYEGESGYDQYYPYEELANIDTGNEPLLAFDWKEPNGTIHRNTGKVDLGTLEWVKNGNHFRTYQPLTDTALPADNATLPNLICTKYVAGAFTNVYYESIDKSIGIQATPAGSEHFVVINDTSYASADAAAFKTAMSGVYLEYELADASKTTEQGTPFPENVAIDDFGTMSFDCPNGVPQGNLIFYPVDYKAEIDTLHNITEGDMHKIALKGELAEGEPETIEEVVDYINARIPAPPAEDGTYNLTVTVASGEATYSWVSAT